MGFSKTRVPLQKRIAQELALPLESVEKVAKSAKYRYKLFEIPKKNGIETRLVAQPAREVKAIQRILLRHLEEFLPVHWNATAYKKRTSIRTNAERHVHAKFITKLDFHDFFPSIDELSVRAHLKKYQNQLDLVPAEIDFIADTVLWKRSKRSSLALCIGAPTSPILSNSILYQLDKEISDWCEIEGAEYTRYSDDITLSARHPNVLDEAENILREIVNSIPYPSLRFNASKRVALGRGSSMRVTGLTLANQGYVTVGRHRKRGVRAGIHSFSKGKLNEDEARRLAGELSFVLSIEPRFVNSLKRSFGEDVLNSLIAVDRH